MKMRFGREMIKISNKIFTLDNFYSIFLSFRIFWYPMKLFNPFTIAGLVAVKILIRHLMSKFHGNF